MMPRRICIVTPNYISGSPRTVKEADALSEAGYDVRVVFSQGNLEEIRELDTILLAQKRWRYSVIGWSLARADERVLYQFSLLRHAAFRWLPSSVGRVKHIAELGHGRVYPELARLAANESADLYIGHYPVGIAAAAAAAHRWNAQLAYDFEDFHVGEGQNVKTQRRTSIIEGRYLKRCAYTTAASLDMADALARHYDMKEPIVIHNVFPWRDRRALDGQIKDRRGASLSIYWYSQTIGLDRGIQDAIRAVGLIDYPVQIHLRGALSFDVKQALYTLAGECGVVDRLYFHERVAPSELLSRAAEHDIGLAAEQPVDLSRQISVTNKLFLYLLAGLCIVATDVPGQRRILEQSSGAGFLYPVGDHQALAQLLTRLVENPDLLQRKKAAALKAANDHWNWEIESRKLVTTVQNALAIARDLK